MTRFRGRTVGVVLAFGLALALVVVAGRVVVGAVRPAAVWRGPAGGERR